VARVQAKRQRLQLKPLFPIEPILLPLVLERGSRHSTPRTGSPRPSTPNTIPRAIQDKDVTIEKDTPKEPEVQSVQAINIKNSETSNSKAQTPLLIFTKETNSTPPTHMPFRAPNNIKGLFGILQAPTLTYTKTPSNRKIKAAIRKLQSSPIKPGEDGNISNGYTIVEGKESKHSTKKSHTALLGKVKVSRLTSTGRYKTLAQKKEAKIQKSITT
jgi:hypothetical protein